MLFELSTAVLHYLFTISLWFMGWRRVQDTFVKNLFDLHPSLHRQPLNIRQSYDILYQLTTYRVQTSRYSLTNNLQNDVNSSVKLDMQKKNVYTLCPVNFKFVWRNTICHLDFRFQQNYLHTQRMHHQRSFEFLLIRKPWECPLLANHPLKPDSTDHGSSIML